jgi:hypothetical protein
MMAGHGKETTGKMPVPRQTTGKMPVPRQTTGKMPVPRDATRGPACALL